MDREILDLFDKYRHTLMDRRQFLDRLAKITGGTAAASAVLPLLEGDEAEAEMVAENDSRLEVKTIEYPGPAGSVSAQEARPKGAGRLPGVIVIHENRGLNAHIRDVGRRAALAGYHTISTDLLSRLGGTPPDQNAAKAAMRKLGLEAAVADLRAGVAYLQKSPRVVADRIGVVGFCWGGSMVNRLAASESNLTAGVAFYGGPAPIEQVPNIRAALHLIYAGNDKRINSMVGPYQEALKRANKNFTTEVYPNVNHAFHNDTSSARYNEKAAKDAWVKTLAFFKKHLG